METVAERINSIEAYTFAYNTMKDRVPEIIVKGLDFFCRTWKIYLEKKNGILPEEELAKASEQAKEIMEGFSKLRYELTTNKPLIKFDDNWEDVKIWNSKFDDYVEQNKTLPTYFDAPMLYTECYVYRSICGFLQKSKYFKNFDVFFQIKRDGLIKAQKATEMVMEYTNKLSERIENKKSSVEQEFINYLEFDLWGNKCDLSLPIGDKATENFNLAEDFYDQLKKQKDKIMCNSTDKIYKFFLENKDKPISRIDIVLDNAGFELIGDFCFIEMLYQTKLIDEKKTLVKFHPKNCSWFVSDVLDHDFHWVLNYLCLNLKNSNAKELAQKWASNLREGRWVLKKHYFWTTPYEYCEMKNISVHLYEDLCQSDFILFKGDLNYRKLVSDMFWDFKTPFEVALRGFHPTNLATLRTIKFYPVCDLKNPELFSSYDEETKHSGELAVISFYKKE